MHHSVPGAWCSSVGAVAKTLHIILTKLFNYLVTQYVDDFPQLEPEHMSREGPGPEDVLRLLGWEVKKGDEGIPTFKDTFICLGVQALLHETHMGRMNIGIKTGRMDRIWELV